MIHCKEQTTKLTQTLCYIYLNEFYFSKKLFQIADGGLCERHELHPLDNIILYEVNDHMEILGYILNHCYGEANKVAHHL